MLIMIAICFPLSSLSSQSHARCTTPKAVPRCIKHALRPVDFYADMVSSLEFATISLVEEAFFCVTFLTSMQALTNTPIESCLPPNFQISATTGLLLRFGYGTRY